MREECNDRLKRIDFLFKRSRDLLIALGDETRQLIIITLLESDFNGIRVGEITDKTYLSRTSVSHHLKMLMEYGVVNVRREGTRNYYYLDSDKDEWSNLYELVGLISIGLDHLKENDLRSEEY